jgi:pimeloyl-ACP methyl ester carboxylesterase
MSAARVGHEVTTGTYWERLGPAAAEGELPLLFVHGGGATGACWRATPDGRTGWADLLAERGYDCWLIDWPGTGRSGNRNGLEIEYGDVVDGVRRVLRDVIGRPVVVVCHSMGGAVTWQLVQDDSDLVTGVVSVAGAYPANVVARSDVVSDDGDVAVIDFADTGVRMTVDRRVMNLYGDGYVFQQGIASSTRFPMDKVEELRAAFVGLPPRMLLQRLGVLEGMPTVDRPSGFAGKPIRLVAGGEDPAHTRAIEDRTVELLRGWGADASLIWLPEMGVDGNGHFMFLESNSDDLLGVIVDQIAAVGGERR